MQREKEGYKEGTFHIAMVTAQARIPSSNQSDHSTLEMQLRHQAAKTDTQCNAPTPTALMHTASKKKSIPGLRV